ncbi:tocopherol cyclase-domain-containing protein [Haematococcus lacustris]
MLRQKALQAHGDVCAYGLKVAPKMQVARSRPCRSWRPYPLLAVPPSALTGSSQTAAASVTTPHSGYHYDGSPRRFFEGWYWKVALPEEGDAFALIYSVEDPGGSGPHAGVGVQVMGPGDGYCCQFSRRTDGFWASRSQLALGASLLGRSTGAAPPPLGDMVPQSSFDAAVVQGFQASSTLQQGAIVACEEGTPGAPLSSVASASWSLTITPLYGWGDAAAPTQRATAGWLSVLSVFEPHWQVMMSHGLASGWLQWGDRRYEFRDAPTYAEKNWGGGFPSKWHWLQCNTWDGQPGLAVTAVGARRALLLGAQGLGLGEEDVGLVGITWSGGFIEMVPWTAELEWEVQPWGSWRMRAVSGEHEVELEAECSPDTGTVLRAPTIAAGLAPFCKDTFQGKARLRVWLRGMRASGAAQPLIDASTTSAALEVGGGPWWTTWSAKAAMREPFRSLVQLPLDVAAISKLVPSELKPPGL